MLGIKLYLAQRICALVMAPLVLAHLAVMIYAVHNGLSAAEILSRTQGSVGWMLFYSVFVLAVSVHAAIGLRVIAFETLKVEGVVLDALTALVLLVLMALGIKAVYAVTIT